MTDCTKKIILILLLWISEVRLISSAPYCEFGTCNETEYCCADGECCTNLSDNFYVMAWLLAGLLIIALVFIATYKCKSRLYRIFSRGSEAESLNPKA